MILLKYYYYFIIIIIIIIIILTTALPYWLGNPANFRRPAYRSFSRDVITVQNQKLKIHQSFYPNQA